MKDRKIITYCTGGIRCEILTVHMKKYGFQNIYQLDGGIVGYGAQYGDDGLWEGALYVFDNRMIMNFSDNPKVISNCCVCGTSTNHVINYPDPVGRELVVICPDCEYKALDTVSSAAH